MKNGRDAQAAVSSRKTVYSGKNRRYGGVFTGSRRPFHLAASFVIKYMISISLCSGEKAYERIYNVIFGFVAHRQI